MLEQQVYIYRRDDFLVSTDHSLLDLNTIHSYLERSYWSPGIPRGRVAMAIENSLCFGLYYDPPRDTRQQIGLARIVTDYVTFAYMADVFVLKPFRGQKLGIWLIDCVTRCPALEGIRSFFLATRDAHGLYEKFGFERPSNPHRLMVKQIEMDWYRPDLVDPD